MTTPTDMYLDLLKKALTRALYEENDRVLGFNDWNPTSWKRRAGDVVAAAARRFNAEVVIRRPYDHQTRVEGSDWPARADTMVGLKRLDQLQMAVESVLADRVPGDLVETGVWRGGSSIFMRGVLKVHEVTDRTVWVCDSFRGLPEPDSDKYPADAGDKLFSHPELAVSVDQVRSNFRRYGLLDEQVQFLEGWFSETLATSPIERAAVLRLDGDLYESTMDALNPLYPKLSAGGYCIIDDYLLPNCRAAVDDYRGDHGITDEIHRIDEFAAYWRKS